MSAAKAYDMSANWKLIGYDGDHVRGTFWVSLPVRDDREFWVKTVDVTIYAEGHHWGRVFHSGDLTASVKGGQVDLRKRGINSDKLADAEMAWDELVTAIAAVTARATEASA